MNVNDRDLIAEILASNQTYADFFDAVQAVFTDNIEFPTTQLARVRFPKQDDDIEIRKNVVRMLGFDVTKDFMDLNEDIFRFYQMFSQYYTTSHTEQFYKFISFVLNREMSVIPLYTEDYKVFYEQPYGTENVDNGSWYRTTHVDVSVDITDLSGKILATPGKSYQDRILDLFFEFAPIQLVVRRFLFSITFKTNFSIIAKMLLDRKFAFIGGHGLYGGQSLSQLQGIDIDGPSLMVEEESQQYQLRLIWTNSYSELITFGKFSTSDFHLLTIDDIGVAYAQPVSQTQNVSIRANYGGYTKTKSVSIVAKESFVDVASISILGKDIVDENNVETYVVEVTWTNGLTTSVSMASNLEWTTNLSYIASFTTMTSGRLTTYSVQHNTQVTLRVNYTSQTGVIFWSEKTITVNNIDTSYFLVKLLIDGPDMLNENQAYMNDSATGTYNGYRCIAKYSRSDDDYEYITPEWYLKSTGGKVYNDGSLVTYRNVRDTSMKLSATYTFRGVTVTHTITIPVLHLDEHIIDLTYDPNSTDTPATYIVGPDLVFHNQSYQYNLSVMWAGGSSDINQGVRSIVRPDAWYCNAFTIDDSGRLKVGLVDENMFIEVSADFTYTYGNFQSRTYTWTKMVHVLASEIKLDFISIRGSQSITLNETKTFVAYAHYSDGTRKVITPIWTVDQAADVFSSIDAHGNLVLDQHPNTSSTSITITAVYTYTVTLNGSDYTLRKDAQHFVAVKVPLITVDSLDIVGADSITELNKESYQAIATKSDNQTVTVVPDWIIHVTETGYDASTVAHIDRNGLLSVRSLSYPTRVILEANFYGIKAYKIINLEKFVYAKRLPPINAFINGPNEIDPRAGYGQYTLYIQQDADSAALPVSADWELSINEDHAVVDDYGIVRILKYNRANTLLTARYQCGYDDPVVATKTILLPAGIPAGTIDIRGPNSVFDESSTPYQAYITRKDGSLVNISSTPDTVWTLTNVNTPHISKIALTSDGILGVQAMDEGEIVTLNCDYQEDIDLYSGTKNVQILVESPTFGVAPFGIDTQAETDIWVKDQMATKNSGGFLTLTVGTGYYGYFMHPVEYGVATFINTLNNQIGGWDGVSWPQNEIGTNYGPMTLDIVLFGVTKQYYLYRTDFPGLGVVQFQVYYQNR